MGIYDRDYYRDPPRRTAFGGAQMWSVNTWLIVVNIAVFLLNNLLATPGGTDFLGNEYPPVHPIEAYGYFSVMTAILHGQAWRFITFQFLHAGIEHIAFNMIALFFFGPLIETYLGSRRYLAFYLLCGVGGPAMYVILWAAHFLITSPAAPLVGASAGIFGVLMAGALVAPDSQVLVYGIIPVRLRTFAWILLAIAAYTVFRNGNNAGGQAAHLGGAAVGWLLIRYPQVLNVFEFPRLTRMRYRP